MALALAQAGADVVLWARRRAHLASTDRAIRRLGRRTLLQGVDVTHPAAVRQAVRQATRRFHRLDILVNNAGVWGGDPFTTLTLKTWRTVLETDVVSLATISQAVAPAMIRRGYGKIINISSTSGILSLPEGAAYGSAKAAVMHLTRIMARELGPRGIRVNSIAPGLFRTDMTADLFDDRAWIAKRRKQIPLRRFGEPADLASTVVFLASAGSDHVTGQTLVVDGGAILTIGG